MKGQVFNPGQPQKKESFDNAQDAHESAVRERQFDFTSPGIVLESQTSGENVPFEIAPDTGLQVRVGTGRAVGPHSSSLPESIDSSDLTTTGAERVLIPAADVTSIPANDYARSAGGGPGTGTGTGPFTESPDGLGGWTATPQSTKTRKIPLTNGSFNYLWISYLRVVDTATTSLHKVNVSNILYTKKMDGYDIVVTTSFALPGGDPKYMFLGSVDLTSSPGSVTTGMISMSGLSYARIRPMRVAARFDTVLAPASYDGTTRDIPIEDHVNAIGTGVVTPTNPHGLTLVDLGFTEDVDLKTHRQKHHTNGLVVPSEASTSSAIFPRTDTSTPDAGEAAMVFLKKLSSSEHMVVDGDVFEDADVDSAIKLLSPVGAGVTGDYYISFGVTNAAGVYGIVLKKSGVVLTLEKRISPFSFNPETEYLVCKVEWNGTAFINPSPPVVQSDDRTFGTISRRNMQRDSVETLQIKDLNVTTPKLADLSVTEPKIGLLAVTAVKLAADSVITSKILDANVTEPKIADDAVTSAKIDEADGSSGQNTATGSGVKSGHIQDDAIVTAKIVDDAVLSAKIAEADGTTSQNTNTGAGVKTGHLQDGAVTTPKLDATVQAQLAGNAIPVGTVFSYAGGSLPTGWLLCDGTLLDSVTLTQYAPLFTIIGTTWGGTGASSFRVPDLRGVFLRGWNDTASGSFSDPSSGSRTNKYTGGSTGNNVGSYQSDTIGDHTHSNSSVIGHDAGPGVSGAMSSYSPSGGFPEARPRNAYVMYMIKF